MFDIFDTANNVSISGLTLTGGWVDDGGGGILFRSADTLTLVDTVVTGNQAANGGGIYSEYEGSVVLQSSTVSGIQLNQQRVVEFILLMVTSV